MTPAIALMVMLPFSVIYAAIAAGIALVGAVLVGTPVLLLSHRFGFRGLVKTTALGAVTAGLGAFVVSTIISTVTSNGLLLLATTIGGATGACYATIYDSVDLSPPQVRWRIMTIVLVAVTIPFAIMTLQR